MTPNSGPSLTPLQQAFMVLERTRAKLDLLEQRQHEPIAILGVGCRLPGGVESAEQCWQLLRDGVDAISEVPPDRWDLARYYDADPIAPGKMYCRHGGFLRDIGRFDHDFFGIAPREAISLDPQHRLLLETTWEALEHAGLAADRLERSSTSVFVGISSFDYGSRVVYRAFEGIDAYLNSGISHSTASGRLSYLFGFQGPCVALDTACSSSLVSVHLACQSLRLGECNLAVAGGVNAIIDPVLSIGFAKARMLSPDGRCKTFDASANGYVRGEGAGMIVLKRLSDALRDGDPVLAVIRGSAVNQDGPSGGLTVPNGPAQEAVIRRALEFAQVSPDEVGYLEAHGTGTQLGDPIELGALHAVFGTQRSTPLPIGSIKTNIGHLEAAAGIASIIKVALMLEHGQLAPHLHFTTPNPRASWPEHSVRVVTQLEPWATSSGGKRFAGVSSFGFSGTNAHIVLEQFVEAPQVRGAGDRRPHVLNVSAKCPAALEAHCRELATWLVSHEDVDLADVSYTLATGRSVFDERVTIVAEDRDQAVSRLVQAAAGRFDEQVQRQHVRNSTAPRVTPDRGQHHDPTVRRKLRLPTYRFQRRNFWVSPLESKSALLPWSALHPLLGTRYTHADGQLVFRIELPHEQVGYLDDHRIGSVPFLPASAYVEMALAAGREAVREQGAKSVALSDFRFLKALPLRREQPVTVHLALTPASSGQWSFMLTSLPQHAEPGASGVLHASGRLQAIEHGAVVKPSLNTDHASMQPVKADELYEKFTGRGLNYGEQFRAVRHAWVEDRVVACEVELPDNLRPGVEHYGLHPVLLDACLQSLASSESFEQRDRFYLPVGIERVRLIEPAGHHVSARAVIRPPSDDATRVVADVELVAPDGRLLAALDGVQLQQLTIDSALQNFVALPRATSPSEATNVPTTPATEFVVQLQSVEPAAQRELLVGFLQQSLMRVLRRDASETPDTDVNLFRLGVDSLLAVEFILEINHGLGLQLPADMLLNHPTLGQLADALPGLLTSPEVPPADSVAPSLIASRWVAHHRPRPAAELRIFCLHHLGGTAAQFAPWGDWFDARIEVCPLELPGRDTRANEPPLTTFARLIDALADEMCELADRPFALVGHSGGALVAFELAQRMRRQFNLQPAALFLGSLGAPPVVSQWLAAHGNDEQQLLAQLGRLETAELGTPHTGNGHAGATVATLAPHVLADLKMFAAYRAGTHRPLECPLVAILGRDDPIVSRENMLSWSTQTNGDFRLHVLPGSHGAWLMQRAAVTRLVTQTLFAEGVS